MFKFEDYQFHYFVKGNRDNLPILFLHGFMGSSKDFEEIMNCFAAKFYCLAVDIPGHGKTQVFGSEECYTMPNTAQALINFLDKLSIEKCGLVGYSMGGRLALYLMLNFPSRFTKVVLESASPGLKTYQEKLTRIKSDAQLATKLKTTDFKSFLLAWYNQQIFQNLKQHPNFLDLIQQRLLENNPLELVKSLGQLGTGYQPYLGDKLISNHIPLLLLVGEYDQKFININTEMTKLCPLAVMKIIPNSGHNIHFDNRNLWIKYVREFYQGNFEN